MIFAIPLHSVHLQKRNNPLHVAKMGHSVFRKLAGLSLYILFTAHQCTMWSGFSKALGRKASSTVVLWSYRSCNFWPFWSGWHLPELKHYSTWYLCHVLWADTSTNLPCFCFCVLCARGLNYTFNSKVLICVVVCATQLGFKTDPAWVLKHFHSRSQASWPEPTAQTTSGSANPFCLGHLFPDRLEFKAASLGRPK